MLAVGCTLFVNMGLSDAIQETLGVKFKILSCVKCFTFWTVLVFLLLKRCSIYTAVPASFLFSYTALWLDLGLSALNKKYNVLYETVATETPGPSHKKRKRAKKGGAGVSSVQK